MTELIIPAAAPAMGQLRVRPLDRFARGVFLKLLGGIERGRVHLVDGAERHSFGRSSARFPLEATITVRHRRFYGESLFGGTIGAAEAYMAGFWTTDDLTALVRIFTLHPELFGRMDKGFARVMAPLYQAFHAARTYWYGLMGWTPDGVPTAERLQKLGLTSLLDGVQVHTA